MIRSRREIAIPIGLPPKMVRKRRSLDSMIEIMESMRATASSPMPSHATIVQWKSASRSVTVSARMESGNSSTAPPSVPRRSPLCLSQSPLLNEISTRAVGCMAAAASRKVVIG